MKDPNIYSRNVANLPSVIKTNAFVIQKYLENPFLINKKKFDIRVWVLVTHEMEVFFFKEGYIRLSSEEYKLDSTTIGNQFIHLTNNAVQKYSTNYNSFFEGNQLSFGWFKGYLETTKSNCSFKDIVERMKQSIKISMQAV